MVETDYYEHISLKLSMILRVSASGGPEAGGTRSGDDDFLLSAGKYCYHVVLALD